MKIKRFISLIIAVVLIYIVSNVIIYAEDGTSDNSNLDTSTQLAGSYMKYLTNYRNVSKPKDEIVIEASSYIKADGNIETIKDFESKQGSSVKTDENGFVEWEANVQKDGLYNIEFEYFPVKGKGSAIERSIYIDSKMPFDEARNLNFERVWTNATEIKKDERGNDLRPFQIENPIWMNKLLSDSSGLYNEPFQFYFSKGIHKIKLQSIREPMVIRSIKIYNAPDVKSYVDTKKEYPVLTSNYEQEIKIQGEDAALKSDSTIYPIFDKSSPATEPFDSAKLRLNTIGGEKWQIIGQWLVWNFKVPQNGIYKISFRARQNIKNGFVSYRTIYIDGKIPFSEMKNVSFPYDSEWKIFTLGGEQKPYLFYFEKGEHQLKMNVTMGDTVDLVERVNRNIVELSEIYRKILMITGPTPDIYRDYEFDKKIPEVISALSEQSKEFKALYDEFKKRTGQNGENIQILKKIYLQTEEMVQKLESLPSHFNAFKNNIGALGTWLISMKQQPLEIDYIDILPTNSVIPKANKGFVDNFKFFIMSFMNSFFEDYNDISSKGNDAVKVWIGNGATGGRDQALVLKQMINTEFTPQSGVKINLQLVAMGSILQATLAGKGPDVALTVGGSDPINYAVRNAVVDLSQFKDFKDVAKRFKESALTPLTFRNGVYGLPETQSFPMMFYRKDILNELNIKVPQTWDDVIEILPELQKKQMNFGLQAPIGDVPGVCLPAYSMFLFQNGGQLYKKDGVASGLDEDISIKSFLQWSNYYVNYKLPTQYDFVNRFRVGEIPIGIVDYGTFNTLSVFAPEINGLWEFTSVPGTKKSDGTIDRSVPGAIMASIIMKKAKNVNGAWEFLKWWTSTKTQVDFGKELESIMGTSARYSSANVEALYQIPWNKKSFDKLTEQWQWVKGIEEVPGGYFTARHLDFAIKAVLNENRDPAEALEDATEAINTEIKAKRKEFGLKD